MVRISFIGAGSVVFARNLLTDVLTFPELQDSTISLMDVDEDRLATVTEVIERTVDEHDLDATVESTTDRRESLADADYVINAIHVGGREPFENEIEIPREHGVRQAVGDTLGPGGVFRALRTIPTMLDVARDMEAVCPDALLLNYTNPMAMLCWAVDEATDVDVIGLCHSVPHTVHAIADYADVPAEEVEYWVAGINHMAWFLDVEHDGEDLYPALHEAASDPEIYPKDNVRFEVLEHFDHFVTESSNHMSEYVPYLRDDPAVIEDYVVDVDSDWYFTDWMETGAYFEHWTDYKAEAAERTADDYDTDLERSEEYGSRVIYSMETGERRRMNLNVRNDVGAIANLPSNACVEVPCLVDDRGVHPCGVGDLPPQLAALDRTNVNVQELAVRGALDDDPTAVRQALKLDPLTAASCTLDEIDALADDLFAANADYLSDDLVASAEF